jgi:hypothetical protein
MVNDMDWESCYITIIRECTKDSGSMIKGRAEGMKDTKMAIPTRESSLTIRQMEGEFTSGSREKFMMVNGKMARSRVMEYGEVCMETVILVNGTIARQKAMECMFGKMETNMRVSGSTVSSMGRAQTCLEMVTLTKDSISMESQKGSDSINGVMVVSLLELFRMD